MSQSSSARNKQLEQIFQLFDQHKKEIEETFFEFLRFESISADPAYRKQVLDCASWLENYLRGAGLKVERWETSGYPVIFAEYNGAGPDKPTVLIYNHYDVQPVDPLELWSAPPFQPTVKDGEVFARGTMDNKGQCAFVIAAVKYLLKRDGKLPVNIKLCIEGEEEVGSAGLAAILASKQKELRADYSMVVDVGFHSPDRPAVTLGVRGITAMTVELTGSKADLHSGSHGGVVFNPLHALVELLGKLRDKNGKILVPGFYADVAELSAEDRSRLDFFFDEAGYEAIIGAVPHGGEDAFSPLESAWIRPTLEINGISGGYSGAGFKTVIPAKATAKISCRLVPNQDPEKVVSAVKKFLEENVRPEMHLDVHIHGKPSAAARSNPSSTIVQASAKAMAEVCDRPCSFILEGGSIPIATELAAASKSELVLIGYGLPDDQMHAPNEHFGLDRLRKGFATMVRVFEILAG